jgi:hypothetical protein
MYSELQLRNYPYDTNITMHNCKNVSNLFENQWIELLVQTML